MALFSNNSRTKITVFVVLRIDQESFLQMERDPGWSSRMIFQIIKSPNLKSQRVSPYDLSDNQVPTSQIARGVPVSFFQIIKSPNLKSQAVYPSDVFRESSLQISNSKGCPPKIFQRFRFPNLKSQGVSYQGFSVNQVPKSQI